MTIVIATINPISLTRADPQLGQSIESETWRLDPLTGSRGAGRRAARRGACVERGSLRSRIPLGHPGRMNGPKVLLFSPGATEGYTVSELRVTQAD